jgi:type II secretory pathway pseudopilin PulG
MNAHARTGDDGQILILALAFITFIALIAVALVTWATTTTAGANNLKELRSARTAADHAVAVLMQEVRYQNPDCPASTVASENSIKVTASCTSQTTNAPGRRYDFFTASWGSLTVLKAAVTFQDYSITSSGLTTSVGAGEQVNEWTYGQ